MSRTNPLWKKSFWRLGGLGALIVLASGILAGSYWMSEYQATSQPKRAPVPSEQFPLVIRDDSLLSGSLFRLPIGPQESLFVQMGSEEGSIHYGIGPLAKQVAEWRKTALFADATHAKWFPK